MTGQVSEFSGFDIAGGGSSPFPLVNVKSFGATGNGSTDDTTSINNAIASVVAAFNWTGNQNTNNIDTLGARGTLYFPTGTYKITAPLSTLDIPIAIKGDGSFSSIILVDQTMSGDVISYSDCWGGFKANLQNSVIFTSRDGPHIEGISIAGQNSSNVQNAMVFYDRNDMIYLRDVTCTNMSGRGLSLGVSTKATVQAYVRESHFRDLRFFSCGSASLPVIEIGTVGNGDRSNTCHWQGIDIFQSVGDGLVLRSTATNGLAADTMFFEYVRIEQPGGHALKLGDSGFTGRVSDNFFSHFLTFSVPSSKYSIIAYNNNNQNLNYENRFSQCHIGAGGTGGGINIVGARDFYYQGNIDAGGTGVTVGPTSGGSGVNLIFDALGNSGVTTSIDSSASGHVFFVSYTSIPGGTGYISVKQSPYNAKGDGVTDDSTAINNAAAALAAAGGGILFFPPGNYLMSTATFIPPSNCVVQGSGIDATTITNTSTAGGQDCTLTVLMTMTGGSNAGTWTSANTTYPINPPTLGANTVTTTTAANAGNFSAGNIIMLSGDTHGAAFWFSPWYTTVVSANASTGVITLAETLPMGGTVLTTAQKIVSLPKNITVRDMTLAVNSNIGGFSGAILEVLGCENFLIENCKFVNVSGTQGAGIAIGAPCRHSGFRKCYAGPVAGPIELYGCSESFISECSTFQSGLLIDGGSLDCTVINNHIKDPQENGASFYGIYIPNYTLRIAVVGNTIVGVPSSFAGISFVDTPDANRYMTVTGNSIVGANTTNTTGVNMTKGTCTANFFQNLQNGIVFESVADCMVTGNYFDSATTTPISTFSGTGIFRTRQNTPMQAMASATGIPAVQGGLNYTLTNGSAQNVTSFSGGLGGDEITIILQDGNTTFVNGSNLKMKSGVNYNPASGVVMCFICNFSGTWSEKSRSQ